MPLLLLRGINKTYNAQSDHPLRVLRDIELSIEPGDFVSIMGPSGSGKSTLLHILGLLDTPDSGSYLLDGRDMTRMPRSKLPSIRSREIGFVFQTFNLLPRMSVYQNIMLPMIYAGKKRSVRRKRVDEVIGMVHLKERSVHHPARLSGGEQQRAAIARAIVNEPRLILADEPTGNLDSENGVQIMRELVRLNETGRTIIIITHDPDIGAYARTHYFMKDGTLRTA
jgi:ABC-type lipoprotein export system ATPase subunit